MFILSSISSGLEFWSVNHTSIYENSQLKVFENMELLGEISDNLPNDLGVIQKWHRWGSGGREYPKLVTKSDIGGRRYMQIVTSPPKKSFYFVFDFGQRGSSWALVSILVVVSFQALAWVGVCRPNKAWCSLIQICLFLFRMSLTFSWILR